MSNKYEVHKLGGAAMGSEAFVLKNAAEIARLVQGTSTRVIAVVSAGGGDTDSILARIRALNPETGLGDSNVDVALSAGETLSAGLLGVAIDGLGIKDVRALSPAQVPMRAARNGSGSSAIVQSVDGSRLLALLDQNRVLVVPGFLAPNRDGDVNTLGRGGSDLSAIALAAGLQRETQTNVPAIFGKAEKGVLAAPKDLIASPALIRNMTYHECMKLLQASDHEFIARRGAEVAAAFGVEMIFRQAGCFVSAGEERAFPGTRISARRGDDVEESSEFRALAARTFVRYDVTSQALINVLRALQSNEIAYEECKASAQGGYKLFLPELDESDDAERNRQISSLQLTSPPRKICIFHFMDSQILTGDFHFTHQIMEALAASGMTPGTGEFTDIEIDTESDTIVVECSTDHMKAVAEALAKHFKLAEQ